MFFLPYGIACLGILILGGFDQADDDDHGNDDEEDHDYDSRSGTQPSPSWHGVNLHELFSRKRKLDAHDLTFDA